MKIMRYLIVLKWLEQSFSRDLRASSLDYKISFVHTSEGWNMHKHVHTCFCMNNGKCVNLLHFVKLPSSSISRGLQTDIIPLKTLSKYGSNKPVLLFAAVSLYKLVLLLIKDSN